MISLDYGAYHVGCAGTETGLAHCSYNRNGFCSGGFREGAEVFCDTRSLTEIEKCTRPGQVCLMGGDDHEGKVYIGVGNGLSKPVCDDAWDSRDGIVVCRELGYDGIVKVPKSPLFLSPSLSLIIDIFLR